jgi:hypothetical protein
MSGWVSLALSVGILVVALLMALMAWQGSWP